MREPSDHDGPADPPGEAADDDVAADLGRLDVGLRERPHRRGGSASMGQLWAQTQKHVNEKSMVLLSLERRLLNGVCRRINEMIGGRFPASNSNSIRRSLSIQPRSVDTSSFASIQPVHGGHGVGLNIEYSLLVSIKVILVQGSQPSCGQWGDPLTEANPTHQPLDAWIYIPYNAAPL
jgi:hypothetical protein